MNPHDSVLVMNAKIEGSNMKKVMIDGICMLIRCHLFWGIHVVRLEKKYFKKVGFWLVDFVGWTIYSLCMIKLFIVLSSSHGMDFFKVDVLSIVINAPDPYNTIWRITTINHNHIPTLANQ